MVPLILHTVVVTVSLIFSPEFDFFLAIYSSGVLFVLVFLGLSGASWSCQYKNRSSVLMEALSAMNLHLTNCVQCVLWV